MKVDCGWITTNLEAYFCDQLTPEQDRLARAHIEACAECRSEIEGLKNVDSLVKHYFQHELSRARAPRPQRSRLVLGAAAAGLVSALIAAAVMLQVPADKAPGPDAAVSVTATIPAPPSAVDKSSASQEVVRAKPDSPSGAPAAIPGGAIDQQGIGSDFLVVDPAGYARTIADYRGYVLLVGVWSTAEPQAAANLERAYQTFGTNTRVRILGASNERQAKPPNTTFPVVYNRGSNLWGAATGDFVLLDESGQIRLRGSLLTDFDSLTETLRTTLR